MKFRSIVFWAHLVAGVCAGLVILMMSATGVLLTFERQITAWAEEQHIGIVAEDAERLSADSLVALVRRADPEARTVRLVYRSEHGTVVRASAGRGRSWLLDPYRGEILHTGPVPVDRFFSTVTALHRWFALSGESRATGRAITGYSNLLFFFLLCTGIYLWLPRIWSRAAIRTRTLFNARAKSGKARDYNWHHVFSFWALVPLALIVPTASVFYFSWANDLVYSAFGEEPQRRRSAEVAPLPDSAVAADSEHLLERAIDELAARDLSDWRSLTIDSPIDAAAETEFRVDRSIGGQPAKAVSFSLDTVNGSVTDWTTFADNTPGRQARIIIRFLHTGEVLGVIGQALAGAASLAACFLVWTGLALAWRRLIVPMYARPKEAGRTA